MSVDYSVKDRGSGSTSSWWKYALIACLGIILAVCIIFGIKAVMSASQVKSETPKPTETVSTPAPDHSTTSSSTAESSTLGSSTAESSTPGSSPKDSKSPDPISLNKGFCSEVSGLCLNYPETLDVKVDKEISEDPNVAWQKYEAHFVNQAGNPMMELQDSIQDLGSGCSEDYDNMPPLHILEAAPTKLKVNDPDEGKLDTYAVKAVVAEKQDDGSLKYGARMYLTQLKELFKPGEVKETCDLEMPDIIALNGNYARVTVYGPSLPTTVPYDSYEEAVQAFDDPSYQGMWETLQSAHNK